MSDEEPGFPHQAPSLEDMLPSAVAGRSMMKYSYVGAGAYNVTTAAEMKATEVDLAAEGLALDDVARAVAGRSDPDLDPPYFVMAFQWAGIPAEDLPMDVGVDDADAAAWTQAVVGWKRVLIGTDDMITQSAHVRGRPYVYNLDDVRFVVTTDDEPWAIEALRRISRPIDVLSDGSEWLNCDYVGQDPGHLTCLREPGHAGSHTGRQSPCSTATCSHTAATGARYHVTKDYFAERPASSRGGPVDLVPITRDEFLCPFVSPDPGHLGCVWELGHAGDHRGALIGCGPDMCDHFDDILLEADLESAESDELEWLIAGLTPEELNRLGGDPAARQALLREARRVVDTAPANVEQLEGEQAEGPRRRPSPDRPDSGWKAPRRRWLWLLLAAVCFALAAAALIIQQG